MKNLFLLLFLSATLNLSAQTTYRGNYEEWSIAFNMGLNKPYSSMSPGYTTSNPSFYHVDLGLRYTVNPYIGVKADVGYDKFKNKFNTKEFNSNYIRVDIQAVADLGYALALYNVADPVGILFHAGAGVSQFDNNANKAKDKMINLIYGFTGTLKVSRNISLSGDISSLMHTKQDLNFDGRTKTTSKSVLRNNLLNSSVGIIYFFRR
jgi:OOP family OmpA-OmpF porin